MNPKTKGAWVFSFLLIVGLFGIALQLVITPAQAQVASGSGTAYGTSERCVSRVGSPDPSAKPSPGPLGCTGSLGFFDGTCIQPPNYPADLRQALIDKFKIHMDAGYDNEHLKATWEMFWCFSGTKFPTLVGRYGVTVHNTGPIHMSCPDGEFGPCIIWINAMPGRMSTFTFILTHEFGHIVNYNNPREVIKQTEHSNVFAQEGGISYYAKHAFECTESSNEPEDYAEMIAYFLHPKAGETTPACDPDKHPPNPLWKLTTFPLHKQLAEKILLQ